MEVPTYRRHPNGQAFVAHRSIAKPSRRLYLGKYGSSESRRRYADFLASLADRERGGFAGSAGSVGSAAAAWIEAATGSEFRARRAVAAALDRAGVAGVECSSFGPVHLAAVREALASHFARSTANRHLSRAKLFVRWGALAGWFPSDCWQRCSIVEAIKRGQSREAEAVRPIEWPAVAACLGEAPPAVATMVRVQYWCGMRPGEVCRITRGELETSGAVWLYRPAAHKSAWRGGELVKAIVPAVQAELLALFSPELARPLFLNQRGRPYTPATYRRACRSAQAAAAAPCWSPNQLRHGIATELARAAGIEAAQRWLGHAKLSATQIYAERSAAELLELAAQVEAMAASRLKS